MKDLNPACFVIRGCRLFFVFFREQCSIESGHLDRIYSELIPSEMSPLPRPPVSPAACTSRSFLTLSYIHTAPSCFSVTNFDTMIPLWTLHTWFWAPACAQSKQGCLFEKKPCLLYLTLENVSCTRCCIPEPILHSLLFSGKEIWYLRHSSVHLSASACGYRSCKGILHRCGTYAVSEVMFFGASKQRTWSQLHYLSKNLTWPRLDILLVPVVWGLVLFFHSQTNSFVPLCFNLLTFLSLTL